MLDLFPAGVHVVIARNHVHAKRRGKRPQRLRVRRHIFGAVIHEIARDGDEIGGQRTRRLHDATKKPARRVRADVQVGKLRDAQPVELGREARYLDVHTPHHETTGAEVAGAECRSEQCERGCGSKLSRRESVTERRAAQEPEQPHRGHHRQHELRIPEGPNDEQPKCLARIERPAAPANKGDERQRGIEREQDEHGHGARKEPSDKHAERSPCGKQIEHEAEGDRGRACGPGPADSGHGHIYPLNAQSGPGTP